MKLTAKGIREAKLSTGKIDQLFWDDDLPGFGLRLRAGGSRNWVFQYAIGDKQRRLSLGAATDESFKAVKNGDGTIVKLGIRDQVADLHAKVRLGQDPAGDKTESRRRANDTFETVAKKYLTAKKESIRPGTYTETERHILKHAKTLNGLQIARISRRDIASLVSTLKTGSGPVAANRVRSTLSDLFGWAISEGIDGVESNPVLGTNKFEEQSRERVLTDDELRVIWKCSGDDHYGTILKLLMLTGQRAEEIAGLRWSEIADVVLREENLDGIKRPEFKVQAIELSAERTKNKRPHIVPMSQPAVTLLAGQPRRVDSDGSLRDLVFGIGQRGFSGWSRCKERLDDRIAKELGGEIPHFTPHDFRRTMSTVMNDRLGILPHVVEAILNHVSSHGSAHRGVGGVYNRALYLRQRVSALRIWADHLTWIVEGEENKITLLRQTA